MQLFLSTQGNLGVKGDRRKGHRGQPVRLVGEAVREGGGSLVETSSGTLGDSEAMATDS